MICLPALRGEAQDQEEVNQEGEMGNEGMHQGDIGNEVNEMEEGELGNKMQEQRDIGIEMETDQGQREIELQMGEAATKETVRPRRTVRCRQQLKKGRVLRSRNVQQ